MSRSGRIPINIPDNTEVRIENEVFFAKGKLGVNLNPNLKEDPELHTKGSVGVRGNLGFDMGRSGSQFSFMPSASYKFGDGSSSGFNLGQSTKSLLRSISSAVLELSSGNGSNVLTLSITT